MPDGEARLMYRPSRRLVTTPPGSQMMDRGAQRLVAFESYTATLRRNALRISRRLEKHSFIASSGVPMWRVAEARSAD